MTLSLLAAVVDYMIGSVMNKKEFYSDLRGDLQALNAGETQFLPLLCNSAALLYSRMEEVNWLGFYLPTEPDSLVLGPFQGNVACVRIPFGKGVCGSSFHTQRIQRVGDVHAFPGHIACDATTNAEIVLPLSVNGVMAGVLDIDSRVLHRFDEEDEVGLKEIVATLCGQLAATEIEKFIVSKHG
ncbi:MAG: Free methionine-R-sulfoxide reductase [Candidatus Erwinia impunctatus]